MIKSTLALASLAFALALTPVQAQTKMSCTEADMTKMNAEGAKMTDATKKAAVMKEMGMARDMMAKKDMTGCMTHMDNAMKIMPQS
jgi:hypothetical protein